MIFPKRNSQSSHHDGHNTAAAAGPCGPAKLSIPGEYMFQHYAWVSFGILVFRQHSITVQKVDILNIITIEK